MRTFTPTEIDLCKKIAEKEMKEIEYGDYFQDMETHLSVLYRHLKSAHEFPLWQEHDCLEWLREKGFRIILHNSECSFVSLFYVHDDTGQWKDTDVYPTPLEALLRAVLAVMEGK